MNVGFGNECYKYYLILFVGEYVEDLQGGRLQDILPVGDGARR
jgi:hypothetical protein